MTRLRAFPAAPHRMMFVAGMLTAAVASLWWAAELLGRASPALAPPARVVPMWTHAWMMLFGLLGPFIIGFLFTTYPRWQSGPVVSRPVYATVFTLLLASLVAALAGQLDGAQWLLAAVTLGGLAWMASWGVLLRILVRADKIVSHGVVTAIGFGIATVAQFAFGFGLWQGDAAILHLSIRVALWAGLLPLAFAVCHRMLPFFTESAVPGYRAHRPLWWLVAVTTLLLLRQALAIAGLFEWMWPADLALFALTLGAWLRWRPWTARGIPRLWTLYAAFLWLPVGLLLQGIADLSFAVRGDWLVGRAPVHALGMGFLGSLVLAMATRVTLGHSGRRLQMDRLAIACFLLLQLATLLRIAGELAIRPLPALFLTLTLLAMAAWLGGLLPWILRYGRMLVLPRIDGRPG